MSKEVHPIFQPILDAICPPPREHVESGDCWCNPTLDYVNPETGAEHWIHHEPN
jgi:hypothetical protein